MIAAALAAQLLIVSEQVWLAAGEPGLSAGVKADHGVYSQQVRRHWAGRCLLGAAKRT